MASDIEREPHDQPTCSSEGGGLVGDELTPVPSSSSIGSSSSTQSDSQSEVSNVSNQSDDATKRRGKKRIKLLRMEITCPICGSDVIGSEDEVNDHINKCVEEKESREQVEEYEWAGYSKIRTTYEEATRLAGSGMLRLVRVSQAEETVSVVDVEGDVNSVFGSTQYTRNGPVGEDVLETEPGSRVRVIPVPVEPAIPTESIPFPTGSIPCPTGSIPCQSVPVQSHPSSSVTRGPSVSETSSNGSKCAVCLDPLTIPVVSVVCWHVHCESCWLQSLKVKQLCPRCTLITSFDDLRKVYL